MNRQPLARIGGASFPIAELAAVADGIAAVQLAGEARPRLERSHEFVKRLAAGTTPVYGLTTGCGPLASNSIGTDDRQQFQRNLIRSHATTLGARHPASFVRAGMAARAHVLARGCSGVDPALVDLLIGMLNAGIHPVVREVGSVGASGDLVELAQIALAAIGEGTVEREGRIEPAADALRAADLKPLVPRYREGLALINGTSFHTGAAAVLVVRARRLADAAEAAAALIFDALGGNAEALSAELYEARPHAGARAVAARVSALLAQSALVRGGESVASGQDAYTLRCIPQVLGVVVDAIEQAAAVIQTEIDSVTDNPLFLAEKERVVHGGNFHGQPVATALDQLKIAAVELGVVCERRIARVLDPMLNAGLPPFLVLDRAGFNSGFMGLQYCASSMAADNAVLAAPASVRSVPTNANNQDVVSMGMVAARQAARVIDNVESMVAIELLCGAQALEIRGVERAGTGTRAAHASVRTCALALTEDRPLADDVDAIRRLIEKGSFSRPADR
jgi:histidine ammonia-lyase